MKTHFFIGVFSLVAQHAFSQGAINFNNRFLAGTSTSTVVAPIYGIDPQNPTAQKFGNGATGPTTPVPAGTQTYAGVPLSGSGYTASLWARPAGTSGPFVLASSIPFRTTTSTSLFGFWTPPLVAPVLPNVPSDPGVRAEVVIRVWDNRSGTITSWDQLYDAGIVVAQNGDVARGESLPFVVPDQLGGGTLLPPSLVGLQSFQLFIVPEPSTVTLFLMISASIWTVRHQRTRSTKAQHQHASDKAL